MPKCEDEIDGECNAQKTIIGARTYHQVKAQLEHRHSDMAPQYPGRDCSCSSSFSWRIMINTSSCFINK